MIDFTHATFPSNLSKTSKQNQSPCYN